MNHLKTSCQLEAGWIVLLLLVSSLTLNGHDGGGYSYEDDPDPGLDNSRWMANLPDCLNITYISLPGTHESMAKLPPGIDPLQFAETQRMSLQTQLRMGIRYIDIRCRHKNNRFPIHQGPVFLDAYFDDVLREVIAFLNNNPSETILMRVKPEHEPENNSNTFDETFHYYLENFTTPDVIFPPTTNLYGAKPTLGEIRGKIVFLQDEAMDGDVQWPSAKGETDHMHGLPFKHHDDFRMQNITAVGSKEEFYHQKWQPIKDHLMLASDPSSTSVYFNHLNAATATDTNGNLIQPWWFASGHQNKATDADRESTGTAEVRDRDGICESNCDTWADFPRGPWSPLPSPNPKKKQQRTIFYEGANDLALEWINDNQPDRVGIIVADFPGPDLINTIISLNDNFSQPTADAGGPYSAIEGVRIKLDASDSVGFNLEYRWDFEDDGIFDTDWTNSPFATYLVLEGRVGIARVTVRNSYLSHCDGLTGTDTASVVVSRIVPVTIEHHVNGMTNRALLSWEAEPGHFYQVWTARELHHHWGLMTWLWATNTTANPLTLSVSDANLHTRRFYKLMDVPPPEWLTNAPTLLLEAVERHRMAYIPQGSFIMGSPTTEAFRFEEEIQHEVILSQGFWMGRFEVTQAEYLAVTGSNPSFFRNMNHPVENVSWFDATNYCGLLTERERVAGRLPQGYVFRLSTEAEWEYACRAGTTTTFHYGPDLLSAEANFNGTWEYHASEGDVYNEDGLYIVGTVPVGSFVPNAFELYDMHGNVWTWCQDWYGPYPDGAVTDPQGPSVGSSKVLRGGAWARYGNVLRSARRASSVHTPDFRDGAIGFRVVLAHPLP